MGPALKLVLQGDTMDSGQGVRSAMEPTDGQETQQHVQTKHLSINIEDDDEVRVCITYILDCGDDGCPVKGQPAVFAIRTCPSGPCK
jgi:hypothetical protein